MFNFESSFRNEMEKEIDEKHIYSKNELESFSQDSKHPSTQHQGMVGENLPSPKSELPKLNSPNTEKSRESKDLKESKETKDSKEVKESKESKHPNETSSNPFQLYTIECLRQASLKDAQPVGESRLGKTNQPKSSLSPKVYYVGKTQKSLEERFQEHKMLKGSKWTKIHKAIRIIPNVVEVDSKSDFAEDLLLFETMRKFGIMNVRGGSFSNVILDDDQKKVLNSIIYSSLNQCFGCGQKGHFVSQCPLYSKTNSKRDASKPLDRDTLYSTWVAFSKQAAKSIQELTCSAFSVASSWIESLWIHPNSHPSSASETSPSFEEEDSLDPDENDMENCEQAPPTPSKKQWSSSYGKFPKKLKIFSKRKPNDS